MPRVLRAGSHRGGRLPRRCTVFGFVALACLGLSARAISDDRAVLDAMSAIDRVYLNALTLSGRDSVDVHFLRPGDPGGIFEWRFTRDADRIALHRKLVSPNSIRFLPKGDNQFLDHDESGNLITNILLEEKFHFSPQELFRLQRYDRCIVSPAGEVISREPRDVVAYFPPDSAEPLLPTNRAMWAMGRGFSPHLQQILESETRPDGLLSLKVAGFDSPASRGVWTLVADPSHSYLVVEAAYTRDGRDEPTIMMKNTRLTTGGMCEVAASANWQMHVGKKWKESADCETAEFAVDEELLDQMEKSKAGPFAPGSLGMDSRSGHIEAVDLRSPADPVAAVQSGTSSTTNRFLLFLNAHLLLAFVVYVLYRRWSARKAAKARMSAK